MSNKEHNRIGFRNRIAKRNLKNIRYSGDWSGSTPTSVFNPQEIPIKAHISAKSEYANHQRNVIDKRLGKTDIQVNKSKDKYYKNIKIIPSEYVPYSILPSKDSE
jgi:hypothetical protein